MANYPVREVDVRCVVDCRDPLGEGAMWCPVEQAVYWLTVPMPSALHRYHPASGKHDSWPMPEMITAMAKRGDGTLLVASHHGLNIFSPADGGLRRAAHPEAAVPQNRSNDCAPDARGRFWLGTMMNNLGPNGEDTPITQSSGALWRVEKDLSATKVISDITITNGVAWSPDSRTLYVSDSAPQLIHAYDFDLDTGTVSNRRVFNAIKDLGYPDGAAVDSEGFLWSARWDGQCVARFDPQGLVERIVKIPSVRVTSIALGGPDFRTAFVTTARHGETSAEAAQYPHQGGLFAFDAPAPGLPRPQFAG